MYDRMKSKLFADIPEMDASTLHRMLLAREGGAVANCVPAGASGSPTADGTANSGDGGSSGGTSSSSGGGGGGDSSSGGGPGAVVVVDTREAAEMAVSMIPGGALRQSDFERQMDRFKGHTVVCYCTIGYRSGNYARHLRSSHAMRALNLSGGILAWSHHHYPLTELYHADRGSGPLSPLCHADPAAAAAVTGATAGATAAGADGIDDTQRSTSSGSGATARVHVFSPKYALHADGYEAVHFPNGVPWLSIAWGQLQSYATRLTGRSQG
eukprot:TRINITY_DN14938_c1_g3_i2.p1 TRINITY_DN14938_c1_g3~~TRINITY_DN14938_c1_g3_i2.p1  ORF type:complete len:308 (+),score=2.50 TRINITY_DN14938_c1_g3_i2:120-926(+)